MTIQMEKPRIHVKTKNLQQLFDYCVESKTEFTVIPRTSNDDWEIELSIKNIMEAIKWGMYLKANKIELVENPLIAPISTPTKTSTNTQTVKPKATKKTAPKTEVQPAKPLFEEKDETTTETVVENEPLPVEPASLLSFDDNSKQDELF